jgi:hypothetical protein
MTGISATSPYVGETGLSRCRPMLRFLTATTAVIGLSASPGLAAVYQAICSNGSECSVTLANGQIITPGLAINKDQVLSWSQGGKGSQSDVGLGVGMTILFGLPGLFAFAAKTHDYQYSINYVDDAGNVQATSVGFKNNNPSNQFMIELMGMTGLSLGEVNKELQGRVDIIKKESTEKARIAALDCSRVLKKYGCSWNSYLEANPNVKLWADKNPSMVQAEKTKLGSID